MRWLSVLSAIYVCQKAENIVSRHKVLSAYFFIVNITYNEEKVIYLKCYKIVNITMKYLQTYLPESETKTSIPILVIRMYFWINCLIYIRFS